MSPDCDRAGPALVLASASPRRRQLLGLLGVPFAVSAVDLDETPRPGEAPDALAARLARAKAHQAARAHPDRAVLAADTVVALGTELLGKPADAAEARAMLRLLRGRPHRVLTGLAVVRDRRLVWEGLTETAVWMRAYADEEVERYIASGRPFDKAGGYGIQDVDFRPVARITGCYPNVVGLPLCETARALEAAQVLGSAARAALPAAGTCGAVPPDVERLNVEWPGVEPPPGAERLPGAGTPCGLCALARAR